jgi:hypothetical protein
MMAQLKTFALDKRQAKAELRSFKALLDLIRQLAPWTVSSLR